MGGEDGFFTDDYTVDVVENKEGVDVYVIVNRGTGVTEYEDYLLPRVLDTLLELQARLEEARRRFNNPPLTVVEATDAGEAGIH